MYKTLFSFCLCVCTIVCVLVCECVHNCHRVFFNVEFLQVCVSLVDETVFSLYLLLFHIEDVLWSRGAVHLKKNTRGPKTCCISITCWNQTDPKHFSPTINCVPKSYQTEPGHVWLRLIFPQLTLSPGHHYQMTLEMLVSLGSRGSMALLACASSRLCSRLFPGGLCPFSSVSGMLQ